MTGYLGSDLPPEIIAEFSAMKRLTDGRIIGIRPLLFHWTMCVDIDLSGYRTRYCYATEALARDAMTRWDGTGDPINWHRHPDSGRRRDIATGREWIAS